MDGLAIAVQETYSAWNIIEMILRILLAGLFGAIIGYDRMVKHKGVGPGTHMLIAATAALIMVVSKYAFADVASIAGSRGNDNSRMAAQVISGVSFLCAAVIFKSEGSIHGLTTAAGMWATAGTGLCFGSGMYVIGSVFVVLAILGKLLFSRIKKMARFRSQEVRACIKDTRELYDFVLKTLQENGNTADNVQIERENGKLHLRIQLGGSSNLPENTVLNEIVLSNPDIYELRVSAD